MRSLTVRLLLFVSILLSAIGASAHDVTITGTQNFSSLDGSSSDHDGVVNGVFAVNDGNLAINGVVNCNDDTSTSACSMAFVVSGNVSVGSTGALFAENRSGGGTGGAITLTVGGNLSLATGAIVSTDSKSSSGATGGNITANVSGALTLASGATIDAGSANAAAGKIILAAGGQVSIDGNVLSGPGRTLLAARFGTGAALDGGTSNQVGGEITITSNTFVEPSIVIGSNASIVSQGETNGAGPVTIAGCGITVRGLVAALSKKDSVARVSIRSGQGLLVDARDLGVAGATLGRTGRIRADAPTGTAINKGLDLFAAEGVQVLGPAAASSTLYALSSLPGLHDSKSYGGLIRIMSTGGTLTASGNVIDNGRSNSGDTGGTIEISAKADVTLPAAIIRSVGDFNTNNPNRGGGSISVRSYSGNVAWTNGLGEVRPTGSNSGLPTADQGVINLTACGTVTTTGTSFPILGVATFVFPNVQTGVCTPAAPSLPAGVPPFVTCNTPPVANDAAASTNEDNSVTITLSGSDADGDPLTFSVVSGPANGSLGPIVPVNATSATVVYTPNANYNGADSFVYQANDGNGGTDTATVTITIAPVNDAPSFQAGPDASSHEDAGPQTVSPWATSISAGPSDESGQSVAFTVTGNTNPGLFAVPPSVSSTGVLTYTSAPNVYGSATITITLADNGGTANGGADTSSAQSFVINVNNVNDAPSFTGGANQTANEDAGAQSVSGWATAINAGPNEGGQTMAFSVTGNSNPGLFSAGPAVSPSGTLTYTPAADANGTASITVVLTDDGGTANGGANTSTPYTFTITVNAVNDAPSFTSGGNVTVLEDSGAYSAAWATAISTGPADENGQVLTFTVTGNSNPSLFSAAPAVSPSGVLSFTLAADAFGASNVTLTLADNGGTANGGADTSAPQSFTITVNAVNDAPSFVKGADVTVNEDSAAYTAANWATGISVGPNEGGQALTFNVTGNSNPVLFASGPAIAADGTLTFTLAANANGAASVTITLSDDGGTANGGVNASAAQSFTINVTAVNDAPSFTSGGNVSVLEDSGAYSAAWATGIIAGPADESGQSVAFSITGNSNPSLFSAGPAISPSGVLTFTLAADAFGASNVTVTLSDDGGTANGGADTSAPQSFTITIDGVNDAPSFVKGADVTVNEDAGAYTAANWATGISAGPNEGGQALTFNVTGNSNPSLFASGPAIAADGTLTFTLAANANGAASVTLTLSDNGGTANGGVDTSAAQSFTITVVSVNDAPSFVIVGNVSALEDSGAQTVSPWASAISAGPADEAGQSLSFSVTGNSNPSLFSAGPAIAADGTLTYTSAANAFGSATITLVLTDNGGTANGGADTSASYSFTITIDPVNDAPSFTAGGDVTVNEDSGVYSAAWASGVSAGPSEAGQTLAFNVSNSNNALFSAQPSISPSGVLTFTPAANAFGTATVTVSLSDNGGTANGGVDTSASVSFTITVNGTNDAPNAGTDSWETEGNTELRVDLAAGLTAHVADTTPSSTGVLDNDADTVEGDPFSITSIVGCSDTVAPFDCNFGDGSKLSMQANGSFSWVPGAGVAGGSFQYVVTDNPAAGTPASATGTVNITVHDQIWYVRGGASGGNGTSVAPFGDFTALNGGLDVDGPGAYIFVHTSTVNGSIALEANQRLWGEGVGLIINRNLNGNGSPATLVAPGTRPTVNGSGNTVSVTNVTGTEIAGLNLSSATANAIDITSNPFGSNAAGAAIYNNVVVSAGAEGIDVNGGGSAGTTVTVNNTPITATGNGFNATSVGGIVAVSYANGTVTSTAGRGISIDGSAGGNLFVTGLSNVTVSGNTAGDGIRVQTASFDAVPGGAFDLVSAGATVGAAGNGVGGNGVVLSNVSGALAFTNLTAYAGTGAAVAVTGSGSGLTITSAGGVASAPAGVGVSVINAVIGAAHLNFTSVSSSNAANGILLNNTGSAGGLVVTGTGTANSGGTIFNAQTGVSLTNTAQVSLAHMNLHDFSDFAIRGASVNHFSMANTTISGVNGDNPAADEASVMFTELTGAATIANSSISGGVENNFTLINTAGTLNRLTISGTTFGAIATLTGDDGVLIEARGTAVVNTTVQNSFFTSARGDHFQLNLINTAQGDLVFSGNTVTNNHPNVVSGGGGIRVTGGGTGSNVTATYAISGNTVRDSVGAAIALTKGAGNGTFSGTIANNVIGVPGVANSGSLQASGISVITAESGVFTTTITGNSIYQYNNYGIFLQTGGTALIGGGTLKAIVQSNVIANPGTAAFVKNGVHLNAGTLPGDTYQVCLTLGGAGSLANALTGTGTGGGTDFRLRQRQSTTVRLPGYAGANNDGAAVVAFVQSNNGGTPTGQAQHTVPTGGGFVGGVCP